MFPRPLLRALAVAALCAFTTQPAFALQTNRPAAARRAASRTEQRPARPAVRPAESGAAAFAEARELLRRDRPEQALARLRAALELHGRARDASAEGAALDTIGDLYRLTGQYGPAAAAYREAAEKFDECGEETNARLVMTKAGEVLYLSGRGAEAKDAFAEGADVPESVRGRAPAAAPSPEVASLSAGGGGPGQGPDSDSAREMRAFELVNAERKAQGLPPLVWDTRLTTMARSHSEKMASEGFFSHVDPKEGGLTQRARRFDLSRYEDIGENLGNSQGYEDPVAFAVDRWINHEGHRENILNTQFTHAGLGVARAKDGTVLFTQVFARFAAAAANERGDDYRDYLNYVKSEFGAARLDYEGGRSKEARAHVLNVLAASAADSTFGRLAQPRRFRAAALTSLGDLSFAEGDFTAALRSYAQAVEGSAKDERPELTWAAHRGAARAYRALAARESDPVEAMRLRAESLSAYAKAAAVVESFVYGSPRTDESRQSFLPKVESVFSEAAAAFAEAALVTSPRSDAPLQGGALAYAERGLNYSEQGRSRALLDLLGDAGAEITGGVPPELLRQRAEIRARQQEIAREVAGVRKDRALTVPEIEALEREAEELERRYAEVEARVRSAAPRYSALTRPQPLPLAEIRRRVLGEKTALIEYGLGEEASYLWAVTSDSLGVYKLPARADLEGKIRDLRARLVPAQLDRIAAPAEGTRGVTVKVDTEPAPASVKDYAASARELYGLLLGPASALTAGRRLLIVPDGGLHYVPFEALVTGEGGDDYASLPYLLRSNEVSYVPSASVLDSLRQRQARAGAGDRVLVLADPVFDDADPRAKQAPAARPGGARKGVRSLRFGSALDDILKREGGEVRLARLSGSRDEAQSIAGLTSSSGKPATVRLDFDASETYLADGGGEGFKILHIATHGILNPERPQFSGLALSLVGDESNDGFLRVDEIFNLRLGARLVVLSACETGLGELRRGEGVSGFTQGFMYAGASDVVVTLWPISDAATARLMPDFYKRFLTQGGPDAVGSLRAAKLEMIGGGRYSAPFYWAPFILIGNSD